MTEAVTSSVQEKIILLRDIHVILDKDLADFYGIAPTRLREQMKRIKTDFRRILYFNLPQKKFILWYRKMRYLLREY